jgi:5-methylcytosine-specific restriction endonuclease McrA
MQKPCSICHIIKPFSEFNKRKDRPCGLVAQCRSCQKIKKAAHHQKNKEKIAARWAAKYHGRSPEEKAEYRSKVNETKRKYYHANAERLKPQLQAAWKRRDPEKRRATRRAWVERNRERLTENARKRAAENPEAARARRRAWKLRHPEKAKLGRRLHRRNKRKMGIASKITIPQWNEILEFYNHTCQLCHKPAGDEQLTIDHIIPISKGGLHTWQNLWPAHHSCNSGKHAKLVDLPYPPHILHFRPRWSIYNVSDIQQQRAS